VTELIEAIRLMPNKKIRASDVLARAFHEDALYRHIFPESDERAQVLRRLFGAVIGYSLKYGLVHTTASVEGAGCWLSPGNTKVTFWRMLRTGMAFQRAVARLGADDRRQLLKVLAFSDEIHNRLMTGPDLETHWYLWALGVAPSSHGQGIGGKLIQPVLSLSDDSGARCYLETFNERNLTFYERWGFVVKAEEALPGMKLIVWSLVREPNS